MGNRISKTQMDGIVAALKKNYFVFAPVRLAKRDTIRYAEISSVSEIVLDEKSHFSPKEVFYPNVQTMFYFAGNEYRKSEIPQKDIIIFARPCDIHAIKKLDAVFLDNGGHEDFCYARRKNKLKIFMLECLAGWENCFCVSTGTNKADDYVVALRFAEDSVLVDVKSGEFVPFFAAGEAVSFTPDYVRKNAKQVILPEIDEKDIPAIHTLNMWNEISENCAGCGGCNAVCGTCSCFDTADIIYNETSKDGERRRIWASCMQENFTVIAGGHKVRAHPGERLRFKTLHKIYDFKKRFAKGNMCVGCGRCDDRCPEKVSFADTINRLNAELVKEEEKRK